MSGGDGREGGRERERERKRKRERDREGERGRRERERKRRERGIHMYIEPWRGGGRDVLEYTALDGGAN